MSNPPSNTTVNRIGRYDIVSELGRGGMGVVYRGEDKLIGRDVAIKTLTEATPELRQRFFIEARSGILSHPNIVTVYEVGEHEGNPFIAMEFVAGDSLEKILRSDKRLTLIEWYESILFKDLAARTYWEWSGDLFAYKPGAATFKAWRKRYLEVYRRAEGNPTLYDFLKGSSELQVNGRPVTRRQLLEPPTTGTSMSRFIASFGQSKQPVPAAPTGDVEKSETVRRFIQRNACELTVQILDLPGIGTNQGSESYLTMRKERLLRFDCGAGGNRVKGYQFLQVDVPAGRGAWVRTAALGWAQLSLPIDGFMPNMAENTFMNPAQSQFDHSALELGDYNGLHWGEFR